jgi:hypothetical protein
MDLLAKLFEALPAFIREGFGMSLDDKRTALCAAVDDSLGITSDTDWSDRPWIKDVFDEVLAYTYDGKTWLCDWSMDDQGTVTLGTPAEAQVTYEPIGTGETPVADAPVAGMGEARTREFREKVARAILDDPSFAAEIYTAAGRNLAGEVIREAASAKIGEKAVADDGTVAVRLIAPGWGSSGYYEPKVLERDGAKAWPAGTLMFWDHQTASEADAQPEGSLNDLAGVLLSDPVYDAENAEGAGLYSKAKVLSSYQETLDEIGSYIGVSVRGAGTGSVGEAEGKTGLIFEQLYPHAGPGCSVDFVTMPGAGGKVLEVFESARGGRREVSKVEITEAQLKEATDARDAAQADAARASEALNVIVAERKVSEKLADSKLPAATIKRLTEALKTDAPTTEDGSLDVEALEAKVEEAIKTEVAYLAEVTGSGNVVGNGGSTTGSEAIDEDALAASLEESFRGMGLDEKTAKAASTARS